MADILIYGCYGYTGKLIAEMCAERGVSALLSGRNPEKVKALADATGLPGKAVDLDDAAGLDAILHETKVVLHCAGPFVRTYKPMLEACLRNKAHYLDITGEIDVFEGVANVTEKAKAAGIMAMPGVGFDVVPTDCVAAHLKNELPDATDLELVIKSVRGGISHGTASTMVLSLGEGSKVRRDGKLVKIGAGKPTITVDLGRGPTQAAGIPWGDLVTAWHTTGIPNITTYVSVPKGQIRMLKFSNAQITHTFSK
ncbi:MAG: saccharopine dehydrogenase NADP-binding domain-containing protein [Bacteroidota bacterium]